jgi:hypothetical protein
MIAVNPDLVHAKNFVALATVSAAWAFPQVWMIGADSICPAGIPHGG